MRVPLQLIVLLILSSNAFGAQGTITGKEWAGWDTGSYNVVVGVIHKINKEKGPGADANRYRAEFLPKATIGGTLDPSLYPTLPAVFYVGKAVGAIAELPREGALVLAVLQLEREDRHAKASALIFSDICTFMPGEAAMVVLKGLDDPRVTETLKKLQDARAHPDPDPNRKPENDKDNGK
jgi:hypothetical protein